MSELDLASYSKEKSWKEKYPSNVVSLKKVIDVHKSWDVIFDKLLEDKRFKDIECELSKDLENEEEIYPKPDYVFNAFKLTPLKKVKVVIIGQDPYFNSQVYKKKNVPEAMGLSFSVPHGVKVPSSLKNIYANLKKYGHMDEIPDHGNLESWAQQGCLMLNSSLTVKDGTKNKNCHQHLWQWFTDEIISYISTKKSNVVFVFWGRDAFLKSRLINIKKHITIVSSHPSGLSVNKPMGNYPPFASVDMFGTINKQLKEFEETEINWNNNIK
jgi:uracil-DNA glycosylase